MFTGLKISLKPSCLKQNRSFSVNPQPCWRVTAAATQIDRREIHDQMSDPRFTLATVVMARNFADFNENFLFFATAEG